MVAFGASTDAVEGWIGACAPGVVVRDVDGAARVFQCVVDPDGPALVRGSGPLAMSVCPRHDDERVAAFYYGLISREVVPHGIAIDDGAAVLLVDGALQQVVAERPHAHVHEVQHVAGEVILKSAWARRIDREGA